MFCKKCGFKMSKDDKYCRVCGEEYKILPEDKRTINTRWLTWIMGIVITICVVCIGLICHESHLWSMIGVYFLQIIGGLAGNFGGQ